MANPDLLQQEDQALVEMYSADSSAGEISSDDVQAFNELIAEQRTAHQDTQAELRDEVGASSTATVRGIGDSALHNPNVNTAYAVHSETWQTERKD